MNADPRFSSNAARMAHLDELTAALTIHFEAETTEHWLKVLGAGGFPAGPVLCVAEMHADPQVRAREMVVEVEHPTAGKIETLGLPVKFSDTPGGVRGPAPRLGEHAREVLREYGYQEAEIAALIASGAVGAAG
ncbi:MAG: CoA transferase [Paracoccaceae bacterium]